MEEAYLNILNFREGTNPHEHPSNAIQTSKYTLLTFLPKGIFYEFSKLANFYFLVSAVIISIPDISPYHPMTGIAPMIFVLTVALIKEAYEDWVTSKQKRHKNDRVTNNTPTLRWDGTQWLHTPWKAVRAGDLLLVSENQSFPADLLLLATSTPTGDCKIQTANLDGETTLKTKQALPQTMPLFASKSVQRSPTITVTVNLPDPQLHRFSGNISVDNTQHFVEDQNLVWRGCNLKSTEYIIGAVIYPGKHSKIMLNRRPTPFKRSRYDRILNKVVLLNLALHTVLCIVAGALSSYFIEENKDVEHIALADDREPFVRSLLAYCTYFILLNNLIPIALVVTIEMVKFFQNIFVQFDVEMYDEEQGVSAKVQSLSILEDMGLVDYVFSDKTGTLTANIMTFKGASIGETLYMHSEHYTEDAHNKTVDGLETKHSQREPHSVDNRARDLQNIHQDLTSNKACAALQRLSIENQSALISEFFLALVLCNEIMTDTTHGSLQYLGSSPDEVALVEAAAEFGFVFLERTASSIKVQTPSAVQEFEVKAINQFTPERKRMSVVVKCPEVSDYRLYVKGADSVIETLLDTKEDQPFAKSTEVAATEFARHGLRTLSIAAKPLTHKEFTDWFAKYTEAKSAPGDTSVVLEQISATLEQDLLLLGSTAVEDQLQEGVPEVLRDLTQAGVKVWMITGDKLETAASIGLSCNLYEPDWEVLIPDSTCVQQSIEAFAHTSSGKTVLLIDGDQVLIALEEPEQFYRCCLQCSTVIVCRASPKVKSLVVKFMKSQNKAATLLAIGDGGNDISMIQSAHIGVGLYGKEGFQAANSSDVAVGKFRFLRDLMFVHGRWTAQRTGFFMLLFLYKVILNNLPQFYFGIYSGFSGQSLYDEGYLVVYNLLVTSWMILVYAIFEQDLNVRVHPQLASFMPALYHETKVDQPFTLRKFFYWSAFCVYSSVFLFWIPFVIYYTQVTSEDGMTDSLHDLSLAVYSANIVIFYWLLGISMNYWSWFQFFSFYGLGVFIYYPFWVYLYYGLSPEPVATSTHDILSTSAFWFATFTPAIFVVLPYYVYYLVTWLFHPTLAQRLAAALYLRKSLPEFNTYQI